MKENYFPAFACQQPPEPHKHHRALTVNNCRKRDLRGFESGIQILGYCFNPVVGVRLDGRKESARFAHLCARPKEAGPFQF